MLIQDPRVPTVPWMVDLLTDGALVYDTPYPEVCRFRLVTELHPVLPLKKLEHWVRSYLRRQRWELAWDLVRLMYTGSLDPVSMNLFQWQGFPGASPLSIYHDEVLLPTPIVGPIKTILANWFALSGGLSAPWTTLNGDLKSFLEDWESPNSPLWETDPDTDLDPYEVLERVGHSFQDRLAYPRISTTDLYKAPPEATVIDGIAWVHGLPLMRTAPFHPCEQYIMIKPTQPWGWYWLEGQRDRVPPLIYEMAMERRARPDG